MEPRQSPPLSETEVHIEEDSKPTGDTSLSNSIMNVEEEEEEHKDPDSVVSGGDALAAGDDGDEEKLEVPEELAKSIVVLTCQSNAESRSCYVFLIGTSHVSEESCELVNSVISGLKPEAVFLELCSSRMSILQPQTLKIPTMWDMIESWKQKQNTFGILCGWFLAKIASEHEAIPGSEFRVAYEEALKCGANVILGDRPVEITFKRTCAKMPLWHKVKLLYYVMFQDFSLPTSEQHDRVPQEMETLDSATLLIKELSKEFPSLMETLVYERDRYMATALLDVASKYKSVVAVVGRAHVNGIKENWKKTASIEDLMEIPSDGSVFTVTRIVSSVAIAVAGTAIVAGIVLARRR
ncbi:uncharacterized protein LOC108857824 [Raphanus sativus]|uniref:Uncharacterized protein LOC108857824 n=1 Tax=Raphanus sativus TaxID=3726 RepID=A0A6J0NRF9_RAPSA|nr:uncharacterized protein LOC108857824 [Raphanus sativus]